MHTSSSEQRKRAFLIDRILPLIILVFGTLSIVLAVSGGIDLRSSGIPFSSRDPLRPAIITFAAALIFTARHRVTMSAWLAWLGQWSMKFAPAIAAALSLYIVFLSMKFGTFVAGGSDSYGYVSQAWLWVSGGVTVDQPFARDMSWPMADFSFAPLGYRAKLGGGGIVPIYAPGLPLLMAAMIYPFGECGPFLVTPLLAGLMIWVTYKIGERVTASRPLALGATILMASSPTFMFMAMSPMSDVPVAALFCSAVLVVLTPMRGRAFITGLLVGVSVLVRPNLAPMAAIFAAYLAWMDKTWRDRIITLIAFGLGCLPFAVTIALIHTHLYGAPWKNGYGTFESLYALSFFGQNLRQFGQWFIETQTPLPLLFVVPLLAIWKMPVEQRSMVAFLAVFSAGIWFGYLFYLPFDAWWYLRFLLASFPPLLILAVWGWQLSLRWMNDAFRAVVLIGMVAGVASFQISQDRATLKLWEGESVYYSTGLYLRRTLPKNAVILSMQHSGSLRMYAERLTLRYDWLDTPEVYQRALNELVSKGYRPYLLMGEGEEPDFRARFKLPPAAPEGDHEPGVLMAELRWPSKVRLYDPLREAPVERPRPIPVLIPHPCRAFY